MNYSQCDDFPTEIVFGIIGPIGCNLELVVNNMVSLAKHFSYEVELIKVSDIIKANCKLDVDIKDQFTRVMTLMDEGNTLRHYKGDNSILAKMAAVEISKRRAKHKDGRVIYLVNSLKHPEEITALRDIYANGFYLFAIHSEEDHRDNFLKNNWNIKNDDHRIKLISRDKDEDLGYGQSTNSAFHLADFFLTEDGDNTKIWNSLERYFDLIFGDPFRTPTFQEYSMFMAHAASIRSADLSRQVGAVIAREKDIISSGANECPKAFGGTYWPEFNSENNEIFDIEDGRDYMRGLDFNAQEKEKIIQSLKNDIPEEFEKILDKNINDSGLKDITEFGRVVHAEMDAILACAKRGESIKDTIMFCTTYPCHNCAKHIVASGIGKVIYIEPYPKSKALIMHSDSITTDNSLPTDKVIFKPFIGVGPRQYINLFSMQLSDGYSQRRKNQGTYYKVTWTRSNAVPRMKMLNKSYIEIETYLDKQIKI
jgi:deoxycytidylate deaminase